MNDYQPGPKEERMAHLICTVLYPDLAKKEDD